MIYFIGGAPRSGKSILCQQFARSQGAGWISTDLITEILREAGIKGPSRWDARPDSVTDQCESVFPFLERFVRGVKSMAEVYVIEGVDFLPRHLTAIKDIEFSAIFLGRSELSLETFQKYHGKSPGYATLPADIRKQIISDVPRWSARVARDANESGYPYIDMAGGNFEDKLQVAASTLLAGRNA